MNSRSAARLQWLQDTLRAEGMLPIAEAAQRCQVSEMTIRRDIAASQDTIVSLGGRLLLAEHPQVSTGYDFAAQQDSFAQAKKRMCDEAARMVEADDTIFVDCGTTLIPLFAQLDPDMPLTVVTYALNVANAIEQMALPHVRLVLLGGLYYPVSQSFGGEELVTAIRRLGINKAFISAAGVHADKGVSCFHFHEVVPKQVALETAVQRILVADESKLDRVRPAFFADLEAFDVMLTSGAAGEALRDTLMARPGHEWPTLKVV